MGKSISARTKIICVIHYETKPDLSATLEYMDEGGMAIEI